MTQRVRQLKPRPCIICGIPTLDRESQYRDPRCAEWLPCALRRNAGRARPKPEAVVVTEAIKLGHPLPQEVLSRAETSDGDTSMNSRKRGNK
jgi:hypothetical protein